MVFDVESIGLHGEGFAVAYIIMDKNGKILHETTYAIESHLCSGTVIGRQWVADNVPVIPITHTSAREMRTDFWNDWLTWKEKGAILVADCAWPVEANFLAACVKDNPLERECQGPYPLHDTASILLAYNADPLQNYERLPHELPAHHPLCDCRHSARIMYEILNT